MIIGPDHPDHPIQDVLRKRGHKKGVPLTREHRSAIADGMRGSTAVKEGQRNRRRRENKR